MNVGRAGRCGKARPRIAAREARSAGLNVAAQRLGLALDRVDPEFDQIADRDESGNLAAVDYREMADAPS